MYFGWGPGCQSVWELHPYSVSGLWAVVFSVCVPFRFPVSFFSSSPFDPPSLSRLPLCRVLLRTSCCLVITVWLSPSLLLFPCRWSLLQPLCSLFLSHSVVVLHRCCTFVDAVLFLFLKKIFLYLFWGGRSFAFPYLFVDLHSFSVVRHATLPSARHALYHGSVLRLFTVLWLVSGSQSCSCAAVSVSSMLWLVFRVDHVHKAPQLLGLTWTHPCI